MRKKQPRLVRFTQYVWMSLYTTLPRWEYRYLATIWESKFKAQAPYGILFGLFENLQ